MKMLCYLFICSLSFSSMPLEAQQPVVRIAILQDGPWMRPFAETHLIHQEIHALLTPEYPVRFPPDKQVHGHWSVVRIKNTLAQLLADPDVVLTLGVIASHQVSQQRQLPKIAPLVLNAKLQTLPRQGQGSGIENLNYNDFVKRR